MERGVRISDDLKVIERTLTGLRKIFTATPDGCIESWPHLASLRAGRERVVEHPNFGGLKMIDGAQRVEFMDVQVLAATDFTLMCRIGRKFMGVPALKTLPGTDIVRRGDRGRLILLRDVAAKLGLCK